MTTVDRAYQAFAAAPLLRAVHGPGYLNVGWRDGGPGSPAVALVDRLLGWAPTVVRRVVDVAAGRAAAAAQVRDRWPGVRPVSVDRAPELLAEAPGSAGPVRADATALPLGCAGTDLVLCVEAALHFDTRRAFFAEAARVLRPGGRLVLTDLLVDPDCPGWAALVPAANRERTTAGYARALGAAGLRVRHLADVTGQTWYPYREALVAAAAEQSPAAAGTVRRLLDERPVYAYLEAVAER